MLMGVIITTLLQKVESETEGDDVTGGVGSGDGVKLGEGGDAGSAPNVERQQSE